MAIGHPFCIANSAFLYLAIGEFGEWLGGSLNTCIHIVYTCRYVVNFNFCIQKIVRFNGWHTHYWCYVDIFVLFFSIYVYFCTQKCRCVSFLLCGKPLPAPIAGLKSTHSFLFLRYTSPHCLMLIILHKLLFISVRWCLPETWVFSEEEEEYSNTNYSTQKDDVLSCIILLKDDAILLYSLIFP